MDNTIKKVALAYSGGLDTSVIIPWLKEKYGCEVIVVVANVGQVGELDGLKERAIKTGASKFFQLDLVDKFIEDYAFPTLKAGAKYEGTYLLGTAIARPIIAQKLVEIAKKESCDAVAHGATGKGNDQIRFEMAIKHFAPDMKIIAPWRLWDIKSRDEEIDYAEKLNLPIKFDRETTYSEDFNLWHLSHEGLDLENPSEMPDYDNLLKLCSSPFKAPDKQTEISITFEKGIPIKVNGKELKGAEIVSLLNKLGGENGIGIDDIVENRLIGMKSRGVYENPGGAILYKAHKILENLTLDSDTMHYKEQIGIKFADLVYNGKWFTPLRESLSAFVDKTQENVTGEVKLILYKGNIIPAGATSPNSLYSQEIATFDADNVYDHKDASGFINLYSLSTVVKAKLEGK